MFYNVNIATHAENIKSVIKSITTSRGLFKSSCNVNMWHAVNVRHLECDSTKHWRSDKLCRNQTKTNKTKWTKGAIGEKKSTRWRDHCVNKRQTDLRTRQWRFQPEKNKNCDYDLQNSHCLEDQNMPIKISTRVKKKPVTMIGRTFILLLMTHFTVYDCMEKFGKKWSWMNLPPKTECDCPSGGGIKNGHICYPLLWRNAERKKNESRRPKVGRWKSCQQTQHVKLYSALFQA